ncbi:MAG: hypothetical protein ACXWVO_12095 [Caulobacteraceae bacterium]
MQRLVRDLLQALTELLAPVQPARAPAYVRVRANAYPYYRQRTGAARPPSI